MLVLGLFFTLVNGISQTAFPGFVDGKLYVRLKSTINPQSGKPLTINQMAVAQNPLPLVFNQLHPKYKIRSHGRAFKQNASSELNRTITIEFESYTLANQLILDLLKDPNVELAEKVPLHQLHLSTNDPLYSNQWYLEKIGAPAAWDYFSTGSNVVIAVVDDAIERFHADLNPNIWVNPGEIPDNGIDDDGNGQIDDVNGWDVANNSPSVDPPTSANSHGTHVAGIASAATNNLIGISSIGFSCKIMCVKSTNQPFPAISHGYEGILYAANNGANIINMSWGGPNASATGQSVIQFALNKGCILVASAGNSNSSNMSYPAAFPGVISVASTDINDLKSNFSNFGGWVKISAPGSSILSTLPGSSYGNQSGTSMASPMVAGLLGLMKSLNPTMPNDDLINCLYSSADDINSINPAFTGFLGAGRINAFKAMECVASTLSRAPIANFDGTPRNIFAEGQVQFTDRSAYSPTSWQWTFDGGSPSSFSGKNPPPVVYNNPGTYSVTLTASNSFGSNTLTRTSYIVVAAKPTCLSVNLPVPATWTRTTHTSGAEGFINGTNVYNERQKAMFFDLSSTENTTLTSVSIGFGQASGSATNKIITIRVLDGTSNTPGNILGEASISLGQIIADVQANRNTEVNFNESVVLPGSKKFFVAVDFSTLSHGSETLSIYANRQNQSSTTNIWSMGEDLVWRRYGTPNTWGLTFASLYIHPFVTPNPARSILNTKNPVICSGNSVQLDGTGSTFGSLIQWQVPGASMPNTIDNQFQVSVQYPNPGSFKVYLLTRGGCNEVRIDSTVVTVNASPSLFITAGKNPICKGESTTLTATGATSYTWSPATGLNTTTGGVVTANPAQTVSYNITGTNGNCSNNIIYELRVTERSASVILNASATSISGPTNVTFNALAENGGANPIFNFFVNNVSQQSGASSTFSRIVSPGDEVKCQMTSSEPCVDEKQVTSNTIKIEAILPVSLISFKGNTTLNGNVLFWATSSENNSKHFDVEKSHNGQAFSKISTVNAAGTSNSIRNYTYTDKAPQAGNNFYRLKMVDLDGSFKYSGIVKLNNSDKLTSFSIQNNPTPANGTARLIIANSEKGETFVTINNLAGQALQSYKVLSINGDAQLNLETDKLKAGTYFIIHRNSSGKILNTLKWVIL